MTLSKSTDKKYRESIKSTKDMEGCPLEHASNQTMTAKYALWLQQQDVQLDQRPVCFFSTTESTTHKGKARHTLAPLWYWNRSSQHVNRASTN